MTPTLPTKYSEYVVAFNLPLVIDEDQRNESQRRMPSLRSIEEFHNLPHRVCIRCKESAQTIKAHVIDRHRGGNDSLSNVAPLCPSCHDVQPIFVPGEEIKAWAWFLFDPWAYGACAMATKGITFEGFDVDEPNIEAEVDIEVINHIAWWLADHWWYQRATGDRIGNENRDAIWDHDKNTWVRS